MLVTLVTHNLHSYSPPLNYWAALLALYLLQRLDDVTILGILLVEKLLQWSSSSVASPLPPTRGGRIDSLLTSLLVTELLLLTVNEEQEQNGRSNHPQQVYVLPIPTYPFSEVDVLIFPVLIQANTSTLWL